MYRRQWRRREDFHHSRISDGLARQAREGDDPGCQWKSVFTFFVPRRESVNFQNMSYCFSIVVRKYQERLWDTDLGNYFNWSRLDVSVLEFLGQFVLLWVALPEWKVRSFYRNPDRFPDERNACRVDLYRFTIVVFRWCSFARSGKLKDLCFYEYSIENCHHGTEFTHRIVLWMSSRCSKITNKKGLISCNVWSCILPHNLFFAFAIALQRRICMLEISQTIQYLFLQRQHSSPWVFRLFLFIVSVLNYGVLLNFWFCFFPSQLRESLVVLSYL